jgi:hypothetical protein
MRTRSVLLCAALAAAVTAATPSTAAAQATHSNASASFLVAGLAQGQQTVRSSAPGGVGFGVKGGLLFSSLREAGSDYTNNNGWEGGIFFGGNRPGTLGVMGEVLYAKKGAKSGSLTADNYYLEIPILLRLNIGSANRNTGAIVYAIGGPAFDVLLKANLNGLDIKDQYESLDIGVIGGAGIEISRFLVEGRFNWGLRNIAKAIGGSTSDVKTKSFAVLAGLRFN